jgi:hypothetical protein
MHKHSSSSEKIESYLLEKLKSPLQSSTKDSQPDGLTDKFYCMSIDREIIF